MKAFSSVGATRTCVQGISHIAEGCSPFTAMPPAAERALQNARMATVHSTSSLCLAFLRMRLPHGRLRQNRKCTHAAGAS